MSNYLQLLKTISRGLPLQLQPDQSSSHAIRPDSELKRNLEMQISEILEMSISDRAVMQMVLTLIIPAIRNSTETEIRNLLQDISERCNSLLKISESDEMIER